jgi:biopolymer transport protein ExbD
VITLARRKRHPGSPDDKLIPMINVIFLLLLFFMIAGHIGGKLDEALQTPESASELLRPAEVTEILLAADGQLSVGGRVLGARELRTELRAGASVSLRADARVRAAHLVPVLEALREAGIERVALVTLRRTRPEQ